MMEDGKQNSARAETDPAELEKLLEIELMQKRAAWARARSRRSGLRALSFLFLFIVVVAALVAFFVYFSPDKVRDIQSNAGNQAQASPAP
jgi:cell division septal protein FtsQ